MNRREFIGRTVGVAGAALLATHPVVARVLNGVQADAPAVGGDSTEPRYRFAGFNERVQAYIVGRYFVRLRDVFGQRGEEAFQLATRTYAEQRGRRMAQRAVADGRKLDIVTYNEYGEWLPSAESIERGESLDHEQLWDAPEFTFYVHRCPWAIQFRAMGIPEAGLAYCHDLDASIYRGFNPQIPYATRQTLHDHDYCIQCSPGTVVRREDLRPKRRDGIRSWEYHSAHSFWTFRSVLSSVFGADGTTVADGVLADVRTDLGPMFADGITRYEHTDFNVN